MAKYQVQIIKMASHNYICNKVLNLRENIDEKMKEEQAKKKLSMISELKAIFALSSASSSSSKRNFHEALYSISCFDDNILLINSIMNSLPLMSRTFVVVVVLCCCNQF